MEHWHSMAILTYSAFNYGHKITSDNQNINFSENGVDELTAIIPVGSYTLGDFVNAISVALNKYGTLDYSVTLDRVTRKITISANASFELWVVTGSLINVSTFPLMGFTGTDRTGASTYESDSPSGYQYSPQFLLQNFTDFEDEQRKAEASISQTASGRVQVTSYGEVKIMSANITLATNIPDQVAIRENLNGVSDLREFMIYSIEKNPLEFIPDENNPNIFTKCLLEKTPESSEGVGFKLKELYSRNLTGYFETGDLQFRKIDF
jgi:hypothetical protein